MGRGLAGAGAAPPRPHPHQDHPPGGEARPGTGPAAQPPWTTQAPPRPPGPARAASPPAPPEPSFMFPATPEGHISQVRWYGFEFLMDELADELEELYVAVSALMASLPHPL
ncbi:hypothetical protein V8C86DRAFT_2474067 [Haematococcus lacustris]